MVDIVLVIVPVLDLSYCFESALHIVKCGVPHGTMTGSIGNIPLWLWQGSRVHAYSYKDHTQIHAGMHVEVF